jgi:tol-pal system protein YbgF
MTLKSRHLSLIAAVAFAAVAAGPAFAQLDPLTTNVGKAADERSDKRLDRMEKTVRELRSIIMQGKDTGKAVVVQPAETQSQIDLMNQKVSDLEGALRRVNSGIDNLNTDIAAMRRENAQLAANGQALAAANARIDSLERQLTALTAAAVAARTPPPPVAPVASNDPAVDFDKAMRLYTDGQFRAAAASFQTYLDAHGDSEDAREASYYLAEAKYRQGDYQGASIGYIGAIRGWPATSWAPDATVKLAQSLIEIRKQDDACKTLAELNSRYPRAGASVKAAANQAKTRARCG